MVKYFKIFTTNIIELNVITHINNLIYQYIAQTDTYIIVKILDGDINNIWNGYKMEDITNEYTED